MGNCHGLMWHHLLLSPHSHLHQNYKIMGCWSFMLCSCSVGHFEPRAEGVCLRQSQDSPSVRRPRLGELSDPQAPYGAPLLLLQLEEALGSEGRGCWVSGAGQGWAEGASGPLWCSVLHQRCFRGVAAVTDPLKSPSCWTEGVHLYLMALCQSWSFHCSTFGSVMCMQGGEAGEEQEQHFNIQGTAPDLQV